MRNEKKNEEEKYNCVAHTMNMRKLDAMNKYLVYGPGAELAARINVCRPQKQYLRSRFRIHPIAKQFYRARLITHVTQTETQRLLLLLFTTLFICCVAVIISAFFLLTFLFNYFYFQVYPEFWQIDHTFRASKEYHWLGSKPMSLLRRTYQTSSIFLKIILPKKLYF